MAQSVDGDNAPQSDAALRDPRAAAEVYFDGACPLCRAEIAAYRKRASRAVAWRDVSRPDAFDDDHPDGRAPADRETLLARFHVTRADGAVVSGARAFFAVWRAMPGLAPLARILDRQPFIAVADAAYWAFLKIRPLWRRPACPLETPDARS
ncbi:MAG: DUF393 domain-containing protein [Pseudomonadota bacterium]